MFERFTKIWLEHHPEILEEHLIDIQFRINTIMLLIQVSFIAMAHSESMNIVKQREQYKQFKEQCMLRSHVSIVMLITLWNIELCRRNNIMINKDIGMSSKQIKEKWETINIEHMPTISKIRLVVIDKEEEIQIRMNIFITNHISDQKKMMQQLLNKEQGPKMERNYSMSC